MALFAVMIFASCDSKMCYCYYYTHDGVYEEEAYTNTDNRCSVLTTSSRTCVEREERMDPNSLAYK